MLTVSPDIAHRPLRLTRVLLPVQCSGCEPRFAPLHGPAGLGWKQPRSRAAVRAPFLQPA